MLNASYKKRDRWGYRIQCSGGRVEGRRCASPPTERRHTACEGDAEQCGAADKVDDACVRAVDLGLARLLSPSLLPPPCVSLPCLSCFVPIHALNRPDNALDDEAWPYLRDRLVAERASLSLSKVRPPLSLLPAQLPISSACRSPCSSFALRSSACSASITASDHSPALICAATSLSSTQASRKK